MNELIENQNLGRTVLRGKSNITFRGCDFSKSQKTAGLELYDCSQIIIDDCIFYDLDKGIVLSNCQDVWIGNSNFSELHTDGIHFISTRDLIITNNNFEDFTPSPTTHPDAIQGRSIPTLPRCDNIVIEHNRIYDDCQGLFLGNKWRNGISDGGFGKVTLNNNYIFVSYANGISVNQCQDLIMNDNLVRTIVGSVNKASINLKNIGNLTSNGLNIAEAYNGKKETRI
jgi:hypothetical protein